MLWLHSLVGNFSIVTQMHYFLHQIFEIINDHLFCVSSEATIKICASYIDFLQTCTLCANVQVCSH